MRRVVPPADDGGEQPCKQQRAGEIGCMHICSCRVCVCQCRGCCSLCVCVCVCVCVCPDDLFAYINDPKKWMCCIYNQPRSSGPLWTAPFKYIALCSF